MDRLIYIFISGETVKSYPNLKQLSQDNPIVPYFSIIKQLKTTSIVHRKDFTIAVTRMKYKTNRGFNKDGNDW